jgi:hypothetical protein
MTFMLLSTARSLEMEHFNQKALNEDVRRNKRNVSDDKIIMKSLD